MAAGRGVPCRCVPTVCKSVSVLNQAEPRRGATTACMSMRAGRPRAGVKMNQSSFPWKITPGGLRPAPRRRARGGTEQLGLNDRQLDAGQPDAPAPHCVGHLHRILRPLHNRWVRKVACARGGGEARARRVGPGRGPTGGSWPRGCCTSCCHRCCRCCCWCWRLQLSTAAPAAAAGVCHSQQLLLLPARPTHRSCRPRSPPAPPTTGRRRR